MLQVRLSMKIEPLVIFPLYGITVAVSIQVQIIYIVNKMGAFSRYNLT